MHTEFTLTVSNFLAQNWILITEDLVGWPVRLNNYFPTSSRFFFKSEGVISLNKNNQSLLLKLWLDIFLLAQFYIFNNFKWIITQLLQDLGFFFSLGSERIKKNYIFIYYMQPERIHTAIHLWLAFPDHLWLRSEKEPG